MGMGESKEERIRLKYQKARRSYIAKTRPIRDIEYLEGIHELQVERKARADALWLDFDTMLGPVLDEFGVAGPQRLTHRNFARRVLSFFLNNPEVVWDKFVETLKKHYVVVYDAKPECLDRIIELTTAFAREIKGGPEVREGGGQET